MTMPQDIRETIPADVTRAARAAFDAYQNGAGRDIRECIARAILAERERKETICAQAYQVIGILLDRADVLYTQEAIRALDYFAYGEVDENFLPWPKDGQSMDNPDYVPVAIRESKEPAE